jgi:hypothetical protein
MVAVLLAAVVAAALAALELLHRGHRCPESCLVSLLTHELFHT